MRMSSTRMYKSWENPSTVNTEVKNYVDRFTPQILVSVFADK